LRTNIVLDDELVDEAFSCSQTIRTKKVLIETARCFMEGNVKQALLNVLLNNALCVALVFAGMRLNRVIMEQSVR
jgi:hypothetical protein